jgi:hypothetical protein
MRKHFHKSFNEAADAAGITLEKMSNKLVVEKKPFESVEKYISKWIRSMSETSGSHKDDLELATSVIQHAGSSAIKILKTEYSYNHEEMVALLCKKQHDYGHNNITNFGVVGVATRVCDKIARIENLKTTGTPSNESLIDSYVDIVGYAMIATMLNEDSFKLKLQK